MIAIPYGKSHLDVAFPYNGLLTSRVDELKSDRTGRELVEEAMASPMGTPTLAALAAGKKRCTIIISDHTRPVPSRDILPPMLAQLRQGNPEIRVTLLVATGFHRLTTTAELEAKLGKEIAGSEKIVVHDAFDPESNVQIGVLPSGAPLVIDADGLNALAADPDILKSAARPVVLTPHPLEFSRLCGRTVADIQADRAAVAAAFAKTYFNPAVGGVLLLKGAGTVITDGETVLINPTGSTALSKGGTGDTLCGMLCAFLAEGASPLDAAMIAAYVHGLAGERAAEVYSDYGVLAQDVSAFAAKVLREITK